MKKLVKIGVSIASIPFLILSGCSQAASTTPPKQTEELGGLPQIISPVSTASAKEIGKFPRFDLFYQPIHPSQKAKPLETNYDEEQLEKMPFTEAHGDTRERSVPLGQTLLKDATDETKGPLQKYRIVSYYGNPNSTHMGILGQYEPQVLMDKLKELTQTYSEIDPERPAIPAIELITTIAQRSPGPDGLYVHQTPKADIEAYEKLTKDNHALLILDIQLGHDSIMHQVESIKEYLKLPNVYLAIDTEFHVKDGQVPGVVLGHVDGANVQKAIDYVSDLIEENNLPDKVVVVHQFADVIIQNKQAIHPTKNVEVVLNNDGFGIPGIKKAVYHLLVRNEPIQYGGFKLFYKNDQPLMTPKDVLELDPAPAFINYQ